MCNGNGMKLNPVVGYMGGKRRLLPRLRPHLSVDTRHYIEPFVGMGAAYLDLRARGFKGPATIADNNSTVASFWRLVHEDGATLLQCAEQMSELPAAVEQYNELMGVAQPEEAMRVAVFLWLTNYAFGNQPPRYVGDGWVGSGTKLTSAAKWDKTFPWVDCVNRLARVVSVCSGLPTEVLSEATEATARVSSASTLFADPPYLNLRSYRSQEAGSKNRQTVDYSEHILSLRRGTLLLSEAREIATPSGWVLDTGSVVNRASQGSGASGKRVENLYIFKENP